MTWLTILFGVALGMILGVPAAYFLLGLATASQSSDLHRDLWQLKVKLARLVNATATHEAELGDDDLSVALAEAREALER